MGRLVDPSKVPHLIVGPGDEPRLFSILLGRRAGLRGSGGQRSHGLTPSARSSRCRTGGVVNFQTVYPSGGKGLALASWCAGSVIKQPCEPVPVSYAPGAHGPDARRRVHRCAARLPARPRPAPLGATNSSPGVCSVPTPPSRCISPP